MSGAPGYSRPRFAPGRIFPTGPDPASDQDGSFVLKLVAGAACALTAATFMQASQAQAGVTLKEVKEVADSHRLQERYLAACMLDPATPADVARRANANRLHAGRRRQVIARRVRAGRLAYARIGYVRSRARLMGDIRRCRVQLNRVLELPGGARGGAQAPGPVGTSAPAGTPAGPVASRIVAAAESKIGSPYVFATAGPRTFDCSGFTWWVMGQAGINYGRGSTYTEWSSGIGDGWQRGRDDAELQVGDLIYSRPSSQGPGHAGVYVGGGEMIHASSGGGRVMRSDITEGYYARNFVGWLRAPELQ